MRDARDMRAEGQGDGTWGTVRSCPLFADIDDGALAELCGLLGVHVHEVGKGTALCRFGEPVGEALYICTGTVSLELYDAWGHRTLINLRSNGFLMGDISIFQSDDAAAFNLVAQTPCTVLAFDRAQAHALLATPRLPAGIGEAVRILCYNLASLATDNLSKLLRRVNLLAQHSVRERIALFLSDHAKFHRSRTFTINMNRQQLADYLAIDRSTLCEELSKMRREGLIEYRKGTFTLLGNDAAGEGA